MIRDQEVFNQLRDTIRRFVNERLIPAEERVVEDNAVPAEILKEMREMGLYGMTVPEEYGGLGLTTEEEAYIIMELGRASPAFRSKIGTNNGIGSQGIVIDGTPEQKARFLPKVAAGEYVASFALTEPDAGSDAASIRTTAILDGDDYVVNGTKRYITNAADASIFTLMARTDPSNKGAGGVSAFIVEKNSPGLTVGKPNRKMGQAGANVYDVIFEDCRVPAANLIGGVPGQGFKTAMKTLDRGRLHISALCVGVSQRLVEESVRYAIDRKQFGQAIADFQLIQAMLADSRTESYAAQCMVLDAARNYDAGNRNVGDIAACKYFASEMVGRVADRAVQIHGGAGYMSEYAVERFYRDVRIFRIYEGTSQIQQLLIARNLIKEFRK
ncbi:acyl-CoA dehydrogenase family protein [Emcibacter sp. SYSU 3D8]|uniref:acyl-CoA dehydrogenase family protein n=1 Tax=Emcibacter sp. SYSU 3D8 TaxID=3133969 RepID=UPI0031FECE51